MIKGHTLSGLRSCEDLASFVFDRIDESCRIGAYMRTAYDTLLLVVVVVVVVIIVLNEETGLIKVK